MTNYNHYAKEQIESFLCDLLNDDDVTSEEIAKLISDVLLDHENYLKHQLKKLCDLRSHMTFKDLDLTVPQQREYTEVKKFYGWESV